MKNAGVLDNALIRAIIAEHSTDHDHDRELNRTYLPHLCSSSTFAKTRSLDDCTPALRKASRPSRIKGNRHCNDLLRSQRNWRPIHFILGRGPWTHGN